MQKEALRRLDAETAVLSFLIDYQLGRANLAYIVERHRKAQCMANQQNYPNLLTIPETANQLRISRWTIYQLIRSGELKTITIASRRFVASDDLANFIKQRKEVKP